MKIRLIWVVLISACFTSCAEDEQRGDPGVGATKVATCATCHGPDGNPVDLDIPTLAGRKQRVLVDAMKAYRDGLRNDPRKARILETLNDDDLKNIAAYYASQKAR